MTSRRTQIYRQFSQDKFDFYDYNGYRAPVLKHAAKQYNPGLQLQDLTPLQRAGYKGNNIISWCETYHGITCPDPNCATLTHEGLLIARVSHIELILMEDINTPYPAVLWKRDAPGLYMLLRQDSHHCFMLSGADCAAMFAKLCALDLRTHKFADLHVAQTYLARTCAILIRRDLGALPAYYVLVDSTYAESLWHYLLDAMSEFKGRVTGLREFSPPSIPG